MPFCSCLFPSDVTGEEEEDVELELKGVKLFVKRGEKSFSDGMLGHVKLLSNRTTLDERIREFWPSLCIEWISKA